jgi:putative ABC transport system permease protein
MKMFNGLKVSFFLACKSIQRGNKGTSVLTVLIISLIFVNLIFFPSIVDGVEETLIRQSIEHVCGNLVIEPKDDQPYIDNADSIEKKINKLPGVVGTSSRYMTGATFFYNNKMKSGSVHSIDPPDEEVVTKFHSGLIVGEYLGKENTNEILLGIDITGKEGEVTGGSDLGGVQVGDKIDVTFSNGVIRNYRVKGIFDISSININRYAFITEKEMESVLGVENQASEILVKLSQRGTEEEYRTNFVELGISEDIKTWEEKTAGKIGSLVNSFSLLTLISTVISLIMAVVVIFIIIYINTVNKKRQIGILKAIGIEQNVIINSYVIQVLFYCFCGIAAGLLLFGIITSYLSVNPIRFPLGYVEPMVEQVLILQNIISLVVFSLIAGFIPAWRTANENILKAIWG